MLNRRWMLAAAAVAIAASAGLFAPAEARRSEPKVTIAGGRVNPRRLPGSGGSVSVSVKVVAKGVAVESVYARATVPGAQPGPVGALVKSVKTYGGTVTVPANPSGKEVFATITVYVRTPQGTPERVVARIKMGPGSPGGGGSGDEPPPPPGDDF